MRVVKAVAFRAVSLGHSLSIVANGRTIVQEERMRFQYGI